MAKKCLPLTRTIQKWSRDNILIEKYGLTHRLKMTLPSGQHFHAEKFV